MRTGALMLALSVCAGVVQAQTMRPFTTFRQRHGEPRIAARVEYSAGSLRLFPGRPAELYRMDLAYDQTRYLPVSDFASRNGTLVLGLRPVGEGGVRVASRNQLSQLATVAFSPQVDLALDLALGAAEADIELGGLRISNLRVKTGASRAVMRFSEPNASRCTLADISAGAAELSIHGLGNSRCDEIEFEGGVGKVLLDFSGSWRASCRVSARMALGELTLRLPRNVGTRLTMDKFLSSFEPIGLIRKGNSYESPGYDQRRQHLDIDLTTAVGGVKVEWEGER
jgi:hypothetical protein